MGVYTHFSQHTDADGISSHRAETPVCSLRASGVFATKFSTHRDPLQLEDHQDPLIPSHDVTNSLTDEPKRRFREHGAQLIQREYPCQTSPPNRHLPLSKRQERLKRDTPR